MYWISIDKQSKTPMIRQLYLQIRDRVLSGKLEPLSRLPSSRELADQLKISRNVVLEAYDLLLAEGYIASRRGSGTFVADGAQFIKPVPVEPIEVQKVTMGYDSKAGIINFRPGTPYLEKFPSKIWLNMYRKVFAKAPNDMLVYGHPEGRAELREAICNYVVRQREVSCHPEQIVITGGTTQAIGIACSLLLDKRKTAILEDPITNDIQLIIKRFGGVIHPIPVDNDGIQTELLPDATSPAFTYVTPSHQFPMGATLTIQRRIDLLKYAEQTDSYIIEDDYDSEFRFDGPPLSSLHGLSPERVIYIGTFSKTLCPAIRMGYLVLPPALIGPAREVKWHSDLHNEVTSQLALAEFIKENHYLRFIGKMRKHYLRRRVSLVAALKDHFGERVRLLGSATGLHLAAQFPGINFTSNFLEDLEANGVRMYPVEMHAINKGLHLDKLMLGYGNLNDPEIERGITILADKISN